MVTYFLDYVVCAEEGKSLFVIYDYDKVTPVAQNIHPAMAAGDFGLHLLRISIPVQVEASNLQNEKYPDYVMAVKRMVAHHNAHIPSASKESLLSKLFSFK